MFFNELNSGPSDLFKYLNKFVKIEFNPISYTSQQKFIQGWIYTIDPVSLSIVLIDDNLNNLTIALNDEIKDLMIIQTNKELAKEFDCLFKNESNILNSSDDLNAHRDHLIDWLIKNHLPVRFEINGVINILDIVYIRSPYGVDDCESTNEIILDRVRQLVLKLINK